MLLRSVLGNLALVALLCTPLACDKTDGGDSKPPAGDDAAEEDGNVLKYSAEARTLKQTATYELIISGGGQYGEAKAGLVGTLDVKPAGDKLTVAWNVDEVNELELKGLLKPKQEEGKPPPPDVKKVLVEQAEGVSVVNLQGKTDEEATKALPENVKRKEEADKRREEMEAAKKANEGKEDAEVDADPKVQELRKKAAEQQILGLFGGVFRLPTLPPKPLEVGKPVTIEEEKEEELPTGGMLPIDSESIYKLVSIDDSSGARIASIQVEIEASGATEIQGGMLVVDQSTEASILFNMDTGTPVSMEYTSSQMFSVGEQGQEITTILSAEYE